MSLKEWASECASEWASNCVHVHACTMCVCARVHAYVYVWVCACRRACLRNLCIYLHINIVCVFDIISLGFLMKCVVHRGIDAWGAAFWLQPSLLCKTLHFNCKWTRIMEQLTSSRIRLSAATLSDLWNSLRGGKIRMSTWETKTKKDQLWEGRLWSRPRE